MSHIKEFRIFFKKSTKGYLVFCKIESNTFSWPYIGVLKKGKEFRSKKYALKYAENYIKHRSKQEYKRGRHYIYVIDTYSLKKL